VYRADAFLRCPLPEEGTGKGFSFLLLLITEEHFFIRVHGNNTHFAICVPYPEFAGADLLLYTDDLTHGAAAVTAALAYKCHRASSFLPVGVPERINIVFTPMYSYLYRYLDHSARYSISPVR
jgi:hypothetical protein